MSNVPDRLSEVISTADEKLEQLLLKAYRIGFFDGHVNGANFQRQELAMLIEASLAESAHSAAAEGGETRSRLAPLAEDHPLVAAVQANVTPHIRLWVERTGPG